MKQNRGFFHPLLQARWLVNDVRPREEKADGGGRLRRREGAGGAAVVEWQQQHSNKRVKNIVALLAASFCVAALNMPLQLRPVALALAVLLLLQAMGGGGAVVAELDLDDVDAATTVPSRAHLVHEQHHTRTGG